MLQLWVRARSARTSWRGFGVLSRTSSLHSYINNPVSEFFANQEITPFSSAEIQHKEGIKMLYCVVPFNCVQEMFWD